MFVKHQCPRSATFLEMIYVKNMKAYLKTLGSKVMTKVKVLDM